jgi:hypothetical protein
LLIALVSTEWWTIVRGPFSLAEFMVNILAALLVVGLFLLGASRFQHRGYFFLDQFCAKAYGGCDHPVAVALLVAVLFVGIVLTRPKS